MKISRITLVTLILGFATFASTAQTEKFTIAGGGGVKQGSTYSAIIQDFASVCSTDALPLEEVNTSGGVQNRELLTTNKVKAAMIPHDLLLASKLENPASVSALRTIAAFHAEEVHLIARADTKVEGGITVFGKTINGDKITYNTPEDLKGRPVGAVGGSVVTARIISDFLKLGLQVKPYSKNSDLIMALVKKDIDAAVVVAGSPSSAIKELPAGQFKFLPVRLNQDLAKAYSPAKIQYENVSDGRAVDSISTQALLVSRTFRSPEMIQALGDLRSCLIQNLAKIQDKDGSHPKWQDLNFADKGKWEWYDLPSKSVAPAKKK